MQECLTKLSSLAQVTKQNARGFSKQPAHAHRKGMVDLFCFENYLLRGKVGYTKLRSTRNAVRRRSSVQARISLASVQNRQRHLNFGTERRRRKKAGEKRGAIAVLQIMKAKILALPEFVALFQNTDHTAAVQSLATDAVLNASANAARSYRYNCEPTQWQLSQAYDQFINIYDEDADLDSDELDADPRPVPHTLELL